MMSEHEQDPDGDICEADVDEDIEIDAAGIDEDGTGEPYEIDTLDTVDEVTESIEKSPSPENLHYDDKSLSPLHTGEERDDDKDLKGRSGRKRSRSCSGDRNISSKEDFDDSELDSDVDDADYTDAAEVEEKELLSMPQLKVVMSDVNTLKTNRRVLVHSLDYNELNHIAMTETATKSSCEEIKINFVRRKDDPDKWSGIMIMNFTSSRAATEAAEQFKNIREDLVVKHDEETAYPRMFVENWIKQEKGQILASELYHLGHKYNLASTKSMSSDSERVSVKFWFQERWTETLLWVKNIDESVTEDQLKEVFYDCEDVVIAKQDTRRSKDEKKTKMAYVVYRTAEAAIMAAKEYADSHIELEGSVLKVYKYQQPADPPRGMLKLHERRVVLKYLEKLSEQLELETDDNKAPDWCKRRHRACTSLVEKDNKLRHSVSLPTPSLDDMRINKGVRVVRGSKRKELLIDLGILPQRRRSSGAYDKSYDRKRSNYGSSGSHGSLLGNPPSLLNMNMRPVPLSLMMQQSSMGYMGRNMMSEPVTKMLRLDSSGNFHIDRHRRDDRDDRSRSSRGSSRYDRR